MADKSQSGTLEDDEFVLFYKMLTQREDVLKVFQEYSTDGQKLSQSDLEDFLREEQLEGGDIQQHAKQLIERYEPSDTGKWTVKNRVYDSVSPTYCALVLDNVLLKAGFQHYARRF